MKKTTNSSQVQLIHLPLRLWSQLISDSLFRNSIFLMLATGVMSVFGFFFWLVNARLVTVENIGLATTLISLMNVISILSLIGFDSAIVRFLWNSEQKNDKLNTSFFLVGFAALVLSTLFLTFASNLSPQISALLKTPFASFFFTIFCVMSALNILTDSVFLAYRETKYSLFINFVFSAIKIFLPFLFFSWGAIGIFFAAAIAQSVGFFLSVCVMIWKFGYRPKVAVNREVLKSVWQFCVGNYFAGVLGLIPVMVLPLLITNHLGPKESAYYYIVMMIGNLLYVIPQATTSSLFSEGSFNEITLSQNIKKSIRLIAIFLIPSIIAILIAGKEILQVFGRNYALGGSFFLYLVALMGLIVSANSVFGSYFKVKKKIKSIIFMNAIYAASTLILTEFLLPMGLFGVGLALLMGNSIVLLINIMSYLWTKARGNWRKKMDTALAIIDENFYSVTTQILTPIRYYRLFVFHGFKAPAVLFYPSRPTTIHTLYHICSQMGYKMTKDPKAKVDAVFAFEDTTIRTENQILKKLSQNKFVINQHCVDISKSTVEKVFKSVFGYGTVIDPRKHKGPYVKKSNLNALHDGKILDQPSEPEQGYIYQKLIGNKSGDEFVDIRVIIFKNTIPYIVYRYKSSSDRFDQSIRCTMAKPNDELSPSEVRNILTFCKMIGLDYGELDTLRDEQGRLYIIDANNTPSGPRPGQGFTKEEHKIIMDMQIEAFVSEFLT